jgi:hypothetical protein
MSQSLAHRTFAPRRGCSARRLTFACERGDDPYECPPARAHVRDRRPRVAADCDDDHNVVRDRALARTDSTHGTPDRAWNGPQPTEANHCAHRADRAGHERRDRPHARRRRRTGAHMALALRARPLRPTREIPVNSLFRSPFRAASSGRARPRHAWGPLVQAQ